MLITLHITRFLRTCLRDNHSIPIEDPEVATLFRDLQSKQGKDPWFYLQEESQDGLPLPTPILWKYSAWRSDCDSWLLARARSEKQREERWIMDENVRRVAKAIQRETFLPLDMCNILAHRKVREGKVNLITNTFKVTLAKTIQEI